MKIAVYAIAKNEAQFVDRFCKSAADADYIVIADTGSTDNTVELAFDHTSYVYNININPWRFDRARDAALALVPADADICISLDLDEVLEQDWRTKIESVWTTKTTRLKYLYEWAPNVQFYYEKIHSRHGYKWKHPCHEYPECYTKEVYAQLDSLIVKHLPDNTKSRAQYLDLLELAVKEDPNCARSAFYYARELTFRFRWDSAIDALENYLNMPEADWDTERSYAMRLLGKCYLSKNDIHTAVQWMRRATAEDPHSRESWVALAEATYIAENWPECYSACMNGLSITDKRPDYTTDPNAWGSNIYDLASIAAWNLGLDSQAKILTELAIEINPANERLQDNLKILTTLNKDK